MILVTGGAGVVGRALVAALNTLAQDPVRVVSSAEVDLREVAAAERLLQEVRPRLIYHLAARVHGLGGNTAFPAEMFTDNIRINTNVIDAAYRAGCEKIVAISTVAAYSSTSPRPTREDAIWDGPPHGSESAYGHAKRAMLAQLEAYAKQYGLRFAYPLLTNVYGPHDRFDPVNGHVLPSLVAKFHQAATRGGRVTVWGTGRAERDFLYSDDAARALMLIGASYEGAINVATGSTVQIRAIVDMLSDVSRVSDIWWDSQKPDGQIERQYDVTKLKELGFEPSISINEGVKRTYNWYAANYPDIRL